MDKKKSNQNAKLDLTGWNTTDADEIARRQQRAVVEKFSVKNSEPQYPYFGTFTVSSGDGKQYQVEVRSLSEYINACNCPDREGNGLGTCKHIEHVLFKLKKLGVKRFKHAMQEGSPRIEIFLYPGQPPTIRAHWPQQLPPEQYQTIETFFSTDGSLLGNPLATYPKLQQIISEDKRLSNLLRLSHSITPFLERQRRLSQQRTAKETFVRDLGLGKRSLEGMKFPLYPYQQDGMMHLAFTERALLADDMGLGKTVQAIAACALLHSRQQVQRVLVVSPASLKAEWEEQIAKFTGSQSLIIQGTRPARLKQYRQPSFFYLTNYEQVVVDHKEIQQLLAPDVVILDEAQRIKNWQTKTASAVKQLKSRYAFVLTGTPLENRIDDVYSITQFLDPHVFGPLFRFNRDFYTLDEKGKAIGYKNLNELHQRLQPIMLRRRKEEVEGQLPSRTVKNYFVGMHQEQRIRYEEYDEKVAKLVHIAKQRPLYKEELEKLQRWLACMRMLCDTPYILDQTCRISPKLVELASVLEELLTDDTAKIIIFSEWERMLQLVRAWLQEKKWGFAWHTGTVLQHKRREEINRFKTHPDCRLFLSTDAGSVGLNLQAANVVINLDLPWNPAKLEQRIARAWRKHQTRHVQVINLVCENSIEQRMLGLLEQKKTLAEGVLEGKDDLTTMALPSGRAAFMARMESLMGTSLYAEASDPKTAETPLAAEKDLPKPEPKIPDPLQVLRDTLLTEAPIEIDLLQAHRHAQNGKATVLAVVNEQTPQIREQVQQTVAASANGSIALELLDRNTFETIQRLIAAGVLCLNQPAETLHTSPALSETRKQQTEKRIQQTKKHLEQAARKQRMAQVLIAGDFEEEAIPPLREAFEATLHAFTWLKGEAESNPQAITTHAFVKEKLIHQHGLPEKTFSLLAQLGAKTENPHPAQVKTLFSDHQEIFEYVDRTLNKAILSGQ